MSLQCQGSFQVCLTVGWKLALCQFVALAAGEGRLVGCYPRLRGPDLGGDSSPVPSPPFTTERGEKIRALERQKEGEITSWGLITLPLHTYFIPSSLLCPPSRCVFYPLSPPLPSLCLWLPLSLWASLQAALFPYQTPGVSEFIQTDFWSGGINTVVQPHVASGLMDCWTLGDRRSFHIVAL